MKQLSVVGLWSRFRALSLRRLRIYRPIRRGCIRSPHRFPGGSIDESSVSYPAVLLVERVVPQVVYVAHSRIGLAVRYLDGRARNLRPVRNWNLTFRRNIIEVLNDATDLYCPHLERKWRVETRISSARLEHCCLSGAIAHCFNTRPSLNQNS